jgi:hypothetical protein
MGLPGFSASASLYKTAIHYQLTGLSYDAQRGQTTLPIGSPPSDLFAFSQSSTANANQIAGMKITGVHLPWGCDVNACLAQVKQDLGTCLYVCFSGPPVVNPFTGVTGPDPICVNSCNATARNFENVCRETGCPGTHCCWAFVGRWGTCSDLTTDVANCGACFNVCIGARPACCSGSCKDLSNDKQNCGQCGNACTGKKNCEQGFCVCTDPLAWVCNGTCTDTRSDPNNCGSCGISCGVNEACCNKVCTPIGTAQNCEGCYKRCDQTCCPAGGGRFACTDTHSDRNNCGGCGISCSASQTCCPDGCHDLQTDSNNCAICGGVCPSGLSCCKGICLSLSTTTNCGTCGNSCPRGASCSNGKCVCPVGTGDCGNICTSLTTTTDCGSCGNRCASGGSCTNGRCVCPAGTGVCGGVCTSLSTTSNCGSCGNRCPVGGSCSGGVCTCPNGVRCPYNPPWCCSTMDQCKPHGGCCGPGLASCGDGTCCPAADLAQGFIGYSCCPDVPGGCCPPCSGSAGQYKAFCNQGCQC